MDIDIKQQVKEILLKDNITMTELVERLNNSKPNKDNDTSVSSLNNKLTRGTIKYSEILEIFDTLGYDIILQKRHSTETQSPRSSSSGYTTKQYSSAFTGATTGFLLGGVAGSVVGGLLGATKVKYGTTTGSKEKNIITGQQAIKNAKEFEKANGYNPIMTDAELYEMEQMQERLDIEHDVEVNIQSILDNIVLNCDLSIRERYQDLMDSYSENQYTTIMVKLTSLYRVVFKFLSYQSDAGLREFIGDLRKLYSHGGLLDLNDDELMALFDLSRYYRDLLEHKEND
jgi:hypothetical protein